jgi:hypothetical protein
MWFRKKPRDNTYLGASCCQCGASEGVKLIHRQERVGCIVSTFTYCQPCQTRIAAERKTFEYQKTHFCNKYQVEFTHPYSKTRKELLSPGGFHSYWMNLCGNCYDIEVARMPKVEEEFDPWGDSTESKKEELW